MIQPLDIRGLTIGEGRTKIIAPIVGATREAIVKKAREFSGYPIDMAEWRADFYEGLTDPEALAHTLCALREALGNMPLLFTVRTAAEGGGAALSGASYTAVNAAAALSGQADLLDVEMFLPEETVRANVDAAHAAGVKVVGSYHDFHGTPAKDELVGRFRAIQAGGADILKIAVMPNTAQDVLTLLAATSEMRETYADRPMISMSMSPKGVISRLAGEVFGSSMSFGAVGQASAPGQIPVGALAQALGILHDAL